MGGWGGAQSPCYWSPDPCLMLFNHSKDIQADLKHIYCVTFHTTSRERKKGARKEAHVSRKTVQHGIHFETFPEESRIEALLLLSPKHDEPF